MANDLECVELDVPSVLALQVLGHCGADPRLISDAMGKAFGQLMGIVQQHGLVPSGPPRAIYNSFGAEGIDFRVAMPIAAAPASVPESGDFAVDTLPGAKALRFLHRGPYRELMATYGRISEYLRSKGLLATEADWARFMPMWEEYLNDPQVTAEPELLTHIYLPLGAGRD